MREYIPPPASVMPSSSSLYMAKPSSVLRPVYCVSGDVSDVCTGTLTGTCPSGVLEAGLVVLVELLALAGYLWRLWRGRPRGGGVDDGLWQPALLRGRIGVWRGIVDALALLVLLFLFAAAAAARHGGHLVRITRSARLALPARAALGRKDVVYLAPRRHRRWWPLQSERRSRALVCTHLRMP